jgi:nitrite reductase/ring-hydroxylating ferredoxin subunit
MAAHERLICAAADLADGGSGLRFTVTRHGADQPAFAIRFRGRAYAYLNRCAWRALRAGIGTLCLGALRWPGIDSTADRRT